MIKPSRYKDKTENLWEPNEKEKFSKFKRNNESENG